MKACSEFHIFRSVLRLGPTGSWPRVEIGVAKLGMMEKSALHEIRGDNDTAVLARTAIN